MTGCNILAFKHILDALVICMQKVLFPEVDCLSRSVSSSSSIAVLEGKEYGTDLTHSSF